MRSPKILLVDAFINLIPGVLPPTFPKSVVDRLSFSVRFAVRMGWILVRFSVKYGQFRCARRAPSFCVTCCVATV